MDGRTFRIAAASFGPKAGTCKSEMQLERASRPVSELTAEKPKAKSRQVNLLTNPALEVRSGL